MDQDSRHRAQDSTLVPGTMYYSPLSLRIFLLACLFTLFEGLSGTALAHHCGPDQPLPERPNHSCRTRTQTWQPGETIDGHPGGSKGRSSVPAQGVNPSQGTSVHCQRESDGQCHCGPRRGTGQNIPCTPDQQQSFQTTPVSCSSYTSPKQNESPEMRAGGRLPQVANQINPPQIWDEQLRDQIKAEVENRARNVTGLDTTRTEIRVSVSASGAVPNMGPTRRPFSEHYWTLTQEVIQEFINSGRTRPPDRRGRNITIVLGGQQSTSSPSGSPQGSSQSGGRRFDLGVTWEANLANDITCEVEKRARNRASLDRTLTEIEIQITLTTNPTYQVTSRSQSRDYMQIARQVMTEFSQRGLMRPQDGQPHTLTLRFGVEQSNYPPPQTVPSPQQPQPQPVLVVYGSGWRQPAGQRERLPLDIEVPTNFPLNVYKEGNLRQGQQGQYYTRFGGRLLQHWRPAQPGGREAPGYFLITTLFTVNGSSEQNLNITVPLYSRPSQN